MAIAKRETTFILELNDDEAEVIEGLTENQLCDHETINQRKARESIFNAISDQLAEV